MRRTALLLAAAAAVADAQERREEPRYRFGISVDMVGFSVTVVDEKKRLVTDLDSASFEIYEDGVRQSISTFTREEVPLQVMVLLDTSSSMQMKLKFAQDAATSFIHALERADEVEVVAFGDRVATLSPMGSDFEAAAQAVRETEADGATALYNAIYISLKKLLEPRERQARQAIIVLSDGADTKSLVGFEDVLTLARKADVTIYAVALRAAEKDLVKDKYREARYAMGKLAEETGGVTFAPETPRELSGIYDRISTELRSQYSMGYVPTNAKADGSWRRLQVRCDRRGVQVRTRVGYYARRAPPAATPSSNR